MADNDGAGDGTEGTEGTGESGGHTSGFTPPATQDELNRIINDRVKRERAKFAGFDEIKSKAAAFDDLQKKNQTEAEKVAERLAAADASIAKVPELVADQLRAHLVAMHKISDDDAELFLTAHDPAVLVRQVDRLVSRQAEQSTERKRQGNHVPREGTATNAPESDERTTVRELFSGGDN